MKGNVKLLQTLHINFWYVLYSVDRMDKNEHKLLRKYRLELQVKPLGLFVIS